MRRLFAFILAFFGLVRPVCAFDVTTVDKSMRAAVTVRTGRAVGSGVLVRQEQGACLFLTCAHVVKERLRIAIDVTVAFSYTNDSVPAVVTGIDDVHDLALLRCSVDSSAQAVRLADAEPRPGAAVFSVGAPDALPLFVSHGWVASAPRPVTSAFDELLLDMTASHGMSGSGVFNEAGELVGIVRANVPNTRIGIAVTLEHIRDFLSR